MHRTPSEPLDTTRGDRPLDPNVPTLRREPTHSLSVLLWMGMCILLALLILIGLSFWH
jgi:hypothetical protein